MPVTSSKISCSKDRTLRPSLLAVFRYWHRLLATCGGWFLWDFSFYGNKVFQSTFIAILSPGASLFTSLLWTLLNSGTPPPQHIQSLA